MTETNDADSQEATSKDAQSVSIPLEEVTASIAAALSPQTTELPAKLSQLVQTYEQDKDTDPAWATAVVQQFAGTLFAQGQLAEDERSKYLTLDALAVWMPYGDKKALYNDVLALGITGSDFDVGEAESPAIERFGMHCRACHANLMRRDWDLDGAEREFRVLLQYIDEAADESAKEGLPRLGMVQYEIAYIELLRGDLEKAAVSFEESADSDMAIGNPIGEFISRSTQFSVQRMNGADNLEEMRLFLADVIEAFQARQSAGGIHAKCIMNANVELFDIAIQENNVEEAARLMELLEADPFLNLPAFAGERWVEELLTKLRARLAIVQNENEQALEHLQKLIPVGGATPESAANHTTEQLAREYLYAGRVLDSLERSTEAGEARAAGLELDDNRGNTHWKQLIESENV